MNKIMNKICSLLFLLIALKVHYIKGDEKILNILNFENSEKHGDKVFKNEENNENLNLLKAHLNNNNLEEALKIIENMKVDFMPFKEDLEKGEQKKKDENNKGEIEKDEASGEDFQAPLNLGNFNEMVKFYNYIQNVLNSKSETSEKKMVRTFLRKSIQNMKKNEAEDNKRSVEDIIKSTEGHEEMLEKLTEVLKIDKEKLEDEEIRNSLNKILIGILRFIDYTNKSNVLEALLDEIEVEEVDVEKADGKTGKAGEDGGGKTGAKKKLQVKLSDSKTHLEMLQKAADFMGLDVTEEKLKEMTSKNTWYQRYLNQILNYASQYEDEL